MKLAALFSGGKDSTMALYQAMKEHDVKVLLSIFPQEDDSYLYHIPAISLTKYIAECIGFPLVCQKSSKNKEEKVLKKSLQKLKKDYDVEGIVLGVVESNYQYRIVSTVCQELNLKMFTPYWQKPHDKLIEEAINQGFEIVIVGVAAYGMGRDWLGKKLDKKTLAELKEKERKYGIRVGGEGGEYETIVLDGPIFKKSLEIKEFEKKWDGVRGELIIKDVSLVEKNLSAKKNDNCTRKNV